MNTTDALYDAVENLVKVKGRHHTEQAYQRLVKAFDAAKDDKPAEQEKATMMCWRCGVDRFKEPCKGALETCPMRGEAHAEASHQAPSTAAQEREKAHTAWFIRRSMFGPWIEVEPNTEGATKFCSADSHQAPSTAAQEDAVACIQAIKDWDTNGFIKRGALLALPQEIRARMQAILDDALAHKGAQEGKKENG